MEGVGGEGGLNREVPCLKGEQDSTVPWLGEGAGAGAGREGTASWVMVTWDPYPP